MAGFLRQSFANVLMAHRYRSDVVGAMDTTVIPGRCEASNPESRDSPMCKRTSEVRAFARPGMTLESLVAT